MTLTYEQHDLVVALKVARETPALWWISGGNPTFENMFGSLHKLELRGDLSLAGGTIGSTSV